MHRAFKLHHHKHTGRLIHHRHTSYWALAALVAIHALLLANISRAAHAETIQVSATVPAPMPSGAAVITSPTEGTVVTDPLVAIAGTCPVISPAIIVALYRDTTPLGSVVCASDGTFAVTITATSGTQLIVARVVTITGQTGASSSPLTLTYTPPVPAVPPATAPPQPRRPVSPAQPAQPAPSAQSAPFVMYPTQPFLPYRVGQPASLTVRFEGGSPPYTLEIAWGDGTTSQHSAASSPASLTHTYDSSSTYTVTMRAIDSLGNQSVFYNVAIDTGPAGHTSLQFSGRIQGVDMRLMDSALVLSAALLLGTLLLWRYEHTHHKQRVAIPIRYRWQRPRHS